MLTLAIVALVGKLLALIIGIPLLLILIIGIWIGRRTRD